ncbi:MAG: hypothetical protein RKE49_02805 [Oceanicaulis sp.]
MKLGFTDEERGDAVLSNAEGKRLTYRRTAQFHGAAHYGRAFREVAGEALSCG